MSDRPFLTVKDLISKLQTLNPDAEVHVGNFCCDGNLTGDIVAVWSIEPIERAGWVNLQTRNRYTKRTSPNGLGKTA